MRGLGWKERIAAGTRKAMPVIKTVEKVAALAVNLKTPTLLGGLALVSTGITALDEAMSSARGARSPNDCSVPLLMPRGDFADAVRAAGGRVRESDDKALRIDVHGAAVEVSEVGWLFFDGKPDDELLEWLRQAIDRHAPPVIEVSRSGNRSGLRAASGELRDLDSAQGPEIWSAVQPMLASGPWTVLLSGPPGVGKTTLAHELARLARRRRVILLDALACGHTSDESIHDVPLTWAQVRDALRLMSAGAVIVDDVDKARISLPVYEALRVAGLVILTANNGDNDAVLDAATTRPERIDEVFHVEAETVAGRQAPFDRLSEAEWERVRSWPAAWLASVARRIEARPDNLRLDDLEERLGRKTRSVDGVMG